MSSIEGDEGDLTRKQRRDQARADRKALEEAAAASAMRRTRLTQLGVAVTVVVVAIVVILLATGGGKSKSGIPTSKHAKTSTTAEVSRLISGIPQSGNTLGSPTAPVTLEYFGDLECPICKDFTLQALPSIIPQWVRTGKLRIEYHSMETATREPEVFKNQQAAALAAGKQQKAWYYIETFYHEQGEEDSGYVTERYLQEIASQVPGLNLSQWSSERTSPQYTRELTADEEAVKQQHFEGTPSFLIGRSGGAMKQLSYSSPTEPGFVNAAVEKLLKS